MSETVAPPDTLLEVRGLRVLYEVRGVSAPAVDGVSFSLRAG
jgi:ABC-type oligopeptide transport system ATPase subunit